MVKKIPMRMCIVCHSMVDKRDLIRIIKTKEGEYLLDTTLKANGRGAYICKNPDCFAKMIKTKGLNRAFKENIPNEVYEKIQGEYDKYYKN